MHLEVTFRNVRPRDEIRRRAQRLFTKVERFIDPSTEAHLIVAHEHGSFQTEITVSSKLGVHQAHDEDEDLRTALDRMFHKIETSLRRDKEKVVDRRQARRDKEAIDGFVPAGEDEEEDAAALDA